MKRFLAYLFLVSVLTFSFQSWTKADDIKDFQIEGISVGDSLLDYFSKSEIKKIFYSNSKKFARTYHKSKDFKVYEQLQFHYKTNDKKFIIYELNGRISFSSNIEECYNKEKEILSELETIFPTAKKNFQGKLKHPGDKSGKSVYTYNAFDLDNGSVGIECTDWSNKITADKGWEDGMLIFIESKEFTRWIRNEAH